ncbi:MAG TPA: tail fiber domain-containing protein [Vicinamibacterales bacterium]|nr:tail fiber domain-containing protein [Vicinamibacterales bacterium]
MATIQRPVKTYGTRSYVAEVAAAPGNQDPIMANEVDADLDTVYSAWNGGVDAVNIKDGAVSRAKLSATDVLPSLPPVPIASDANKTVVVNATGNGLILGTGGTFAGATPPATPQVGQLWWRSDPDGNLFIYYDDGNSKQFVPAVPSSVGPWSVSGATITPTDATKRVVIPGPTASGADQHSLSLGSRTMKTHLGGLPGLDGMWMSFNRYFDGAAWQRDDPTKDAWTFNLPSGGEMSFTNISAAGAVNGFLGFNYDGALRIVKAGTNLLTLDNIGALYLQGANTLATVVGTSGAKSRFWHIQAFDTIELTYNFDPTSSTRDDAAKPGGRLYLQAGAGGQALGYQVRSTSNVTTAPFLMDGTTGNLTISGSVGQKASGTTWANPSDPRLKNDISAYVAGLEEILALEPITYRLKAQPDGPVCYGFDAAQVRDVFPECVTTTRMKLDPADEEDTDDVLVFDMHPILVALVNAVKELAGKVGA